VIYNGERLFLWNFINSTAGTGFSTQVPQESNWAGLYFYTTNNRVYLIDKAQGQVISYAVSDRDITKPTVSINSAEVKDGLDLSVDGNIYILTPNTVKKFQAGKQLSFNFPVLSTPLSGQGRIFTDSNTANLYILDSGNKRIIITDKNAKLIQIIESPQMTNPIDFIVDEKNKIILVLNDINLLKLKY
jgi:sugar lactone lactonase YvrE